MTQVNATLTDGMFLWIDLFLVLPFVVTMSQTAAATGLSKLRPQVPSMLHCVAVCCSVLQYGTAGAGKGLYRLLPQVPWSHTRYQAIPLELSGCSVVRCVAVWCNVVQCGQQTPPTGTFNTSNTHINTSNVFFSTSSTLGPSTWVVILQIIFNIFWQCVYHLFNHWFNHSHNHSHTHVCTSLTHARVYITP